MPPRLLLPILLLGMAWPAHHAHAHHGRDFLVLQDYYLPDLFNGVLTSSLEASATGDFFSYNLEPQLIFGVLPRVGLGASVSFADETGMNWVYEAVTTSVFVQLTSPDSDFPIRIAMGAGYQFAGDTGADATHVHFQAVEPTVRGASRSSASSSSRSGTTAAKKSSKVRSGPSPTTPPVNPSGKVAKSSNPDDPGGGGHDHSTHDHGSHSHASANSNESGSGETANASSNSTSNTGHSHGGGGTIHVHGQESFIGTLIFEADLTRRDKAVFNLINVTPMEGKPGWGYAAGVRHNLTHDISVSVEATGDFASDGYQELNLGIFYVPHHNVTLRLGVGTGLSDQSPDLLLRTGIVWRF